MIAALRAVQKLYVELFFSDSVANAYALDPNSVLANRGLPEDWRQRLPVPGAVSFEVERHGRRIMVAREVLLRFNPSIVLLIGEIVSPASLCTSSVFREFLASDYFLGNQRSLPHPYGIGNGYESVSKFYFWCVDGDVGIHSADSVAFKIMLSTDFSAYLLKLVPYAKDPFYRKFAKGIYFPRDASGSKLTVISCDLEARTVPGDYAVALDGEGFFNLISLSEGGV